MKSLINPYELLGVNINSTLKEVKKAYYLFLWADSWITTIFP